MGVRYDMVMTIEKWIGKQTTNNVAQNLALLTDANNYVWFDFKVFTSASLIFS